VRVLIRVPEAYLLLEEFSAKRPGLVVLDSDGRRVDSLSLKGAAAADVATWLEQAQTKGARERLRYHVPFVPGMRAEELRKTLASMPGVHTASLEAAELIVEADPGSLAPGAVAAAAKDVGLEAELVRPVPVHFKPKGRKAPDPMSQLARVPGVWYVSFDGPTAWVTPFLIDPDVLAKAAPQHETGLETRRYTFKSTPKGGSGATLARAPLQVAGVLAVFPDIFDDAVTVVGRKGFDDARVRAAFEATGSKPEK
jgi:hypothetical protein